MLRPASDKVVIPFVLIFQGRCGSTYMMEALGDHPDIRCCLEHLATMKRRSSTASDQLQWVRRFLSSAGGSGARVSGFKTKLKDVLDVDGFGGILRETEARIVHLQRRNRIKATVSFFNSVRLRETTGDFNLYDHKCVLPPIDIDPKTFDQWLQAVEKTAVRETEYVRGLGLRTLDLHYEDLLVDEHGVFRRIFSFLSVSGHPIKGRAIKSTSDRLRDSVGNFDQLRQRYLGTPYEQMFDEALVEHEPLVSA